MGVGDVLRRLDSRLLPPLARALRRLGGGPTRLRLVTGLGLLCACAVLLAAVWAADRGPVAAPAPPGDVVRVGVVEGQSVPGYVDASDSELAALLAGATPAVTATEVYALVTFVTYLAPDRLAPVLADVAVSQVYARAPLPGLQTQVVRIPAYRVPADVTAGLLDAARGRDQEIADYGQLRAALRGDSEAERRLRAAYDRAAAVAAAEATAYRSACSCVYAAVVRATPPGLDQLARRAEVRAVDPAPEVNRLDRAEFRPPLPEQMVYTDRPAPRPTTPGRAPVALGPTRSVTEPPPTLGDAPVGTPVISASPSGPVESPVPATEAASVHSAVPSSEPPSPSVGTSP